MEKYRSRLLEKEFEFERLSLFSDAVFAIAITLLVIDIKWPEGGSEKEDLWPRMAPTVSSFIGFALSFFFIGRAWSQHLRIFRLLEKFDQGLIARNLLNLFFIVTFPFSAAGLFGHTRPGFLLPLYIYLVNLMLVAASHYNLCRYVVRSKSFLTKEGEKEEKNFIYLQSKYVALAMLGMVVVVVGVSLVTRDALYVSCSSGSGAIFLRIANKKANKFAPVSTRFGDA
jgi:uncharacterized membrane protein